MAGIGPKNRVSEPVTGGVALAMAATAIANQNWPAAAGYAVLAVIPWITSWLADQANHKP